MDQQVENDADIASPNGCSVDGSLGSRIACILSYNGSTLDICINYTMLAVNLVACKRILTKQQRRRDLLALLFGSVWIFQICLCLFLAHVSENGIGCAGISIVWCAMAGWAAWWLRQQQRNANRNKNNALFAPTRTRRRKSLKSSQTNYDGGGGVWDNAWLVANAATLFYYFVTEDIITTVAHICALIMGILLEIWATTSNK